MLRVFDLRENPSIGGINTQLVRVYPALSNIEGLSLTVGYLSDSPNGWLLEKANDLGLELIWIPYKGPYDIRTLPRLASFIQCNQLDIVHTQGFRGNVIVRTLLSLGMGKFKTVITKHGVAGQSDFKLKIYGWLDTIATIRADKVVAIDQQTYYRMLKYGVSPEKLIQINNPAPEVKKFQIEQLSSLRKSIGIPDHNKIMVFVGRMVKEKGIFDLIEAHRLLTTRGVHIDLLFIGDGEGLEDLSRTVKEGKIDRVHFLGAQPDANPYIQMSNLLVLPSYGEGMPNVVLEALAACIPVVATKVGGIPDIIRDGWNGYLVEPQDVVGLANKIEAVLCSDQFLDRERYELGEYSQSDIALRYFNVYNEVANAQP